MATARYKVDCSQAEPTTERGDHVCWQNLPRLSVGGAPLPIVAANLGHFETWITERHYAHLVPSHVAPGDPGDHAQSRTRRGGPGRAARTNCREHADPTERTSRIVDIVVSHPPRRSQPGTARHPRAAGLDDVRIHDLRHSFASIAVSGGDSLYLVGKVLGHRQSRTTERYAHLKDDPLRAVANRTSERIAAIMQGSTGTKVVPLPSPKTDE
jgi:Phage integrase family